MRTKIKSGCQDLHQKISLRAIPHHPVSIPINVRYNVYGQQYSVNILPPKLKNPTRHEKLLHLKSKSTSQSSKYPLKETHPLTSYLSFVILFSSFFIFCNIQLEVSHTIWNLVSNKTRTPVIHHTKALYSDMGAEGPPILLSFIPTHQASSNPQ